MMKMIIIEYIINIIMRPDSFVSSANHCQLWIWRVQKIKKNYFSTSYCDRHRKFHQKIRADDKKIN